MRNVNLFIKRTFDMLISSMGILVMCPCWIVIFVVMKITMPGPVLFKQERIGKNLSKFTVLKFRTMKVDKDAEDNFRVEKDDSRITKFGSLLRRTKLDETPQLINVLKGDMSLVGPRPTVRQIIEQYPEGQTVRHSMRPGMTGLSQVSGNVLLSWPKRIEYDCCYIKKFNVLYDIKLLLKTVGIVLLGEDKFISDDDSMNNRNPSR